MTQSARRLSKTQATDLLVTAATDLLARHGPSELQARTVATAAGLSSSAVYHHLGGLPELMHAVVERGFEDLSAEFVGLVESPDPVADLFSHALAMRQFAQDNPHRYDLMFGLSTRGTYRSWEAESADRRSGAFRTTYSHLVRACERAVQAGRLSRATDPDEVADQLWCCVHGFLTLELGQHLAHRASPVQDVLRPLTTNVLTMHGDSHESAAASHAVALAAP
ncbi:TetR/AcrR family transcriptional regulator [Nocardioides sp. WS12]|uniref:TetR/AcrR family transcriptional regulator n=1 Tax=Nocardioides sp. WS12 TaxID=2486272 RepID=UPI0015F95B6A|nr:TetR/AcrR family transcriptional regulator [Nocardioides sp. WS12]